jgi:hypothetical protein
MYNSKPEHKTTRQHYDKSNRLKISNPLFTRQLTETLMFGIVILKPSGASLTLPTSPHTTVCLTFKLIFQQAFWDLQITLLTSVLAKMPLAFRV